jgi:tetratricopeptide (TPR) repeat protein/DNA-binding CsgD family transcriptional regulator
MTTKIIIQIFTLLIISQFKTFSQNNKNISDTGIITSLLQKSEQFIDSDYFTSLIYANQALDSAMKIDFNKGIADSYFEIGKIYFKNSILDSSEIFYNKALEKYSEINEENLIAELNKEIGILYITKANYSVAFEYFYKSVELGNESNDANCYNFIAEIFTIQGNYIKAIEYLFKALEIRDKGDNLSELASNYNDIAIVYTKQNEYESAKENFYIALNIYRKLKEEQGVALCLNNIGVILREEKQYHEALITFKEALLIYEKLEYLKGIAYCKINIAKIYSCLNEFNQAIEQINEANIILYKINNKLGKIKINLILGNIYIAQNKFDKADSIFDSTLETAIEFNSFEDIVEIYLNKSIIYSKNGDFEDAYNYHLLYSNSKDSIFNLEKTKQLMYLKESYEIVKKEKEIEELKFEYKLKKRQQYILIVSLLGLLFTIILLIYYLKTKSESLRKTKLLREQETKIHLQEKALIEEKNINLNQKLELKNKELTTKAILLANNNEIIQTVITDLKSVKFENKNKNQLNTEINEITKNLVNNTKNKSWEEFEFLFLEVHKDFYKNLLAKFPDLTTNEKRICAFLKLNMSTKDIAAITQQSVHSINVARTRLRKKLNIVNTNENLSSFLENI